MQLTNILRDVGEDLNRNRIYLPKSELEQFGITENKLFERRCDETFKNFMRLQIKRARYYFKSAERDRKSTRLNSSHVAISYAVFCLKKKNSRTYVSYPS